MSGFVVLMVLDGWGVAPEGSGNAIAAARTPSFDSLMSRWPNSTLKASGAAVGLPEGQMGNSEVGHMTIGAGRILLQPLSRMNEAVRTGALWSNDAVRRATDVAGGSLHLIGMLSDGGVHSHQEHLFHFLELSERRDLDPWIHVLLDGRDTPPRSAGKYLGALERTIARHGGRIGTIAGRYYAMDRDNRWDRTRLAYDAMVNATGPRMDDWRTALESSYADGRGDEFLVPTVIGDYTGMDQGDSVLMVNFRPDRIRQISEALTDPSFNGFERGPPPRVRYTTMMEVSEDTSGEVALPPVSVKDTLGEVISLHGTQLRLAETEKYAHVTFFLNGGRRKPFTGEARVLVPSPKVATYDTRPEMSAHEVAGALIENLGSGHLLMVVNFANPDMVGHTGDFGATVRAVEAVDSCIGMVCDAVEELNGNVIMIADHGNAEQMMDGDGIRTAHSLSRVPCIVTGVDGELVDGELRDVAPTVLTLLGIDVPDVMTGRCLLE